MLSILYSEPIFGISFERFSVIALPFDGEVLTCDPQTMRDRK
jgi:hypothetical protein